MKMALENKKDAVIPEEVRAILAKEVRRALRAHEDALTTLVCAAVASAIAELLNGKEAA
jgi:hypothetical protein